MIEISKYLANTGVKIGISNRLTLSHVATELDDMVSLPVIELGYTLVPVFGNKYLARAKPYRTAYDSFMLAAIDGIIIPMFHDKRLPSKIQITHNMADDAIEFTKPIPMEFVDPTPVDPTITEDTDALTSRMDGIIFSGVNVISLQTIQSSKHMVRTKLSSSAGDKNIVAGVNWPNVYRRYHAYIGTCEHLNMVSNRNQHVT